MRRILSLVSSAVEGIRINALRREQRREREFWVKTRRSWASPVLAAANVFFRMAGCGMRVLPDEQTWMEWEVGSFRALHGEEGFRAAVEGARTIAMEQLPGINLTAPLDAGSLTPAMAAAAGRELARVHGIAHPDTAAPWSHGDAHLGNFIYDNAADRARMIDFEVRHEPALSADVRQADDVTVLLQDLLGRDPGGDWLACALAFLRAYGRAEILVIAARQLAIPRAPLPLLWLRVRTSFAPMSLYRQRVRELHAEWPDPAAASPSGATSAAAANASAAARSSAKASAL